MNNPLNLVDLTGEMFDWVKRTVDGVEEIYYDRDVQSQEDVDRKYGKNAGVTWLADGSTVANGQFTVFNDHVNNKYGTVLDNNSGNTLSIESKPIMSNNYTLFAGTSDNSVNAATLHGNWFNSSYIGPNNPQSYGNEKLGIKPQDNYDYKPIWSPTEMAAYRHDRNYDELEAKGIFGAISPMTKCADLQLIHECNQILKNPNASSIERSRAKQIKTGFSGLIFLFKTPHR
jgi:hypothetical protein